VVGETTGDHRFVFEDSETGLKNIDIEMDDLFGKAPKTIMNDVSVKESFKTIEYKTENFAEYLNNVLQLESVACKDWLTNKVDRSVTGRVAKQQNCGELQLPLNNVGVMTLDYRGKNGIATSIGHAPVPSIVDAVAGSRLAIAEAMTNIVWAPLEEGIKSVALSANWMWPCKNAGEDARLYNAVEAVSEFAIALGINIPTGKDSLSMVQKYPEGKKVLSPGTVIISAGAACDDIQNIVSPNLQKVASELLYVDFSMDEFKLGASVFAQTLNRLGNEVPDVKNPAYFKNAFEAVQECIRKGLILAGHDVSEGGLITALLEMTFADNETGLNIDLTQFTEVDYIKVLFAENPAVVVQVADAKAVNEVLSSFGIHSVVLASVNLDRIFAIKHTFGTLDLVINDLRDTWYKTSYLLDQHQSTPALAKKRFENYKKQSIPNKLPSHFTGKLADYGVDQNRKAKSGIKAAIIREKGTNGDREMAYIMHLAGFDVKDIHMTDLASGREDLSDVNFIVFCGGFSNSDVLGSAKGWAGAFLYNETAKTALDNFYARPNTMSLGVCNGCQLMIELGLINPDHDKKPKMEHNNSHKFESNFVGVKVPSNESIMLKSIAGTEMGIWIAHGEGKFNLPKSESEYNVVLKYAQTAYPGNPNGSDYNVAGICSNDGRHLAMMPHLERAFFPYQCAYYPNSGHEVTPWFEAFVNAKKWVEKNK
jgi:phosphoribosylformylglycinamidine synthase